MVEFIVIGDIVVICLLDLYVFETLFRRQIAVRVRMCVDEKRMGPLPNRPKWLSRLYVVWKTRQRVRCGLLLYTGLGDYIPPGGGAIPLSDVTVLGFSGDIGAQHDQYARYMFSKGDKRGEYLGPRQPQGIRFPGRNNCSPRVLKIGTSIRSCVSLQLEWFCGESSRVRTLMCLFQSNTVVQVG